MLNKIEFFLIRNVIAPLWAIQEKTPYLSYLKYLHRNQYINRDEMRRSQENKLSRLLKHAYKDCPYYRDLFVKLGLTPEDIKSLDDLKKLPILTKNYVRMNKGRMLATNIKKDKLIPKKTSGSTGVSLELYMDVDCSEWRRAVAIFRNTWSGWKMGERIAALWGNPPSNKNWRLFLRNIFLERHIYLDTLEMDENSMLKFLECIKRFKPTILFGHAHSLYLFAQFLEKKSLSRDINFKAAISTAMILYEWQREKIEKVFNCKVFNRYGCEEVSLIASECEKHQGLHVNTDSLLVEFIKDGKPALPGEEASVVVTDLMNYGMPFIRYQIDDVAIFTDKMCSCGRKSLLIKKVIGRDADYILTPEGRLISGISLTENFSLKIPGVEQMQLEQIKLDSIQIRIVKDHNFNDDSENILYKLSRDIFGPKMQCEYKYMDKIQQEKSGKYRFVISRINR